MSQRLGQRQELDEPLVVHVPNYPRERVEKLTKEKELDFAEEQPSSSSKVSHGEVTIALY